jgi:hypothetical protein
MAIPVQYDQGKKLTLDEQILQKSQTGEPPIGIIPQKK